MSIFWRSLVFSYLRQSRIESWSPKTQSGQKSDTLQCVAPLAVSPRAPASEVCFLEEARVMAACPSLWSSGLCHPSPRASRSGVIKEVIDLYCASYQ